MVPSWLWSAQGMHREDKGYASSPAWANVRAVPAGQYARHCRQCERSMSWNATSPWMMRRRSGDASVRQ